MNHNNQLYKEIKVQLQESDIMKEYALKGIDLQALLDNQAFVDKISDMVKNSDYSCKNILTACNEIMLAAAENSVPQDWLSYSYYYTLNKSFPQAVPIKLTQQLDISCSLYLNVLRTVLEYEKTQNNIEWQEKNTISFLKLEEEKNLENPLEYRRFKEAFKKDYIYEMMRLAGEVTGHSTLEHVCGVHYLAMYIGRQLHSMEVPIDLGRVSGSAAGHDIGKYGCKDTELSRVPYLHYYYTDYWFKKHDIPFIGHIAVNHSTWDLELENLPLESLILIYSDFRVKSVKDKSNKKHMHIFSLEEAFDVIFSKLDNMTKEKKQRYERVYAKIKDFEDYIKYIGVQTNPLEEQKGKLKKQAGKSYSSLMQGDEIVTSFKNFAINHNIMLMYKFRDEHSLNRILESARNEKDWKNLREYIRLFEEYFTYLTQKQKLSMIKFLYEQLINTEDDIRRHCAELIGKIIAAFDEDYRKEAPRDASILEPEITSVMLLEHYFRHFLYPSSKHMPLHRQWIGYSAGVMVARLFKSCKSNHTKLFINTLIKYYTMDEYKSEEVSLYMLESARHIPLSGDEANVKIIAQYIEKMLSTKSPILRLASLELLLSLYNKLKDSQEAVKYLRPIINQYSIGNTLTEQYLINKISRVYEKKSNENNNKSTAMDIQEDKLSEMFLTNLKTDTHWLVKKIQIQILLNNALDNPDKDRFHTAMHFCNLLKVSATEKVRNCAGLALLKLVPLLPYDQRNDITIELVRALEIDGYQYANYIPYYLGQIMLCLSYGELKEFIDDMVVKIKHPDPQLNSLLLRTMGIFLGHYIKQKRLNKSEETNTLKICRQILQLVINSLADYDLQIKQAAFAVIGKELFGSDKLDLDEKNKIFSFIAKKVLTLITDIKEQELQFLSNSAAFNQIYRFISEYTLYKGAIQLDAPRKVAFYTDIFDPFTTVHKEIAKTIRDMGFEVYLAVDEFSWEKQATPNLIRKNITCMSVADEVGIYMYPDDFPTNIGSNLSMGTLKSNFPDSEVYIVINEQTLLKSDCYKMPKRKNSIHNFSHIIIQESGKSESNAYREHIDYLISKIEGKVKVLDLPKSYEEILSCETKDYISENADLSDLIDPLAQKYIYEHGIYQSKPRYKSLIRSISIDVEIAKDFDSELLHQLTQSFFADSDKAQRRIEKIAIKQDSRILLLKDIEKNGEIIGFSIFHRIRTRDIYSEFKDSSISNHIYDIAVGNIAFINGIFIKHNTRYTKLEYMVLTETLAYCLANEYDFSLYCNTISQKADLSVDELLDDFGYIKLKTNKEDNAVFAVNMTNPCTLYMDIRTTMKEPYKGSAAVGRVITKTRRRLMKAIAELYPGNLMLPFDRAMLHETLIKKICKENGVQIAETDILGASVCVPYGTILHDNIIPNTITKSLHTEKYFNPDVQSYNIGAFPYYLDLDIQLRIVNSFGKPIILVDDLLNKGYRINTLGPILNREKVEVKKVIVGILSDRGKELAEKKGWEVDSAYYVPKLRVWFNESAMYPFIGGDALWRGAYPMRNLLPSVNLMLPYVFPTYIKGASKESIYNLSKVAIENSIDIMLAIEEEYQYIKEKPLTLSVLGDVFVTPRCPDHGKDMEYNINLSPSHYLKNDLELLKRIEHYGK